MSIMLNVKVNAEEIICGGCGVLYWVTEHFDDQRRKNHKGFYCPNGCCRSYKEQSEEEKLRSRLTE